MYRVKKYAVDAEGEETGWTTYFVDPETARIYAEADNEGAIQATYVYGNGIDELLSVDRLAGEATERYYFHEDALGSVVLVTDDAGNNVEKYVSGSRSGCLLTLL